jgi:ribosomal protein L23
MVSISITGDPNMQESEKNIYDIIINKPFQKSKIHQAFEKAMNSL